MLASQTKGATDQGYLDGLVVTVVLSIFETG